MVLDDNEEYIEREDEFDIKHIKPPPLTPNISHTAQAASTDVDGAEGVVEGGGGEDEDSVDICGLDEVDEEDESSGEGKPLLTLPLERSQHANTGSSSGNSAAPEPAQKRQKSAA